MPARVSKTINAAAPAKDPTEPKIPGWLARMLKLEPHVKRFVVWTGVALVGTYAMGSAANHFLSGEKNNDRNAKAFGATNNPPSVGGSYGGWWNPSGENTRTSKAYGATPDDHQAGTSSSSVSVIPANTGMPVFSGTLNLTNLAPISSNSSRQAHDILGLRTGNTPTLVAGPTEPNMTAKSSITLVSFSLSGDIAQVPVNNLEAGGINMTMAAIPEPTTGAMLAVGLVGLAVARRRQAPRAA